jgi:hypothetical protein
MSARAANHGSLLADPERNEFCILESRSPIGTQSAEGTP